MLLRSCCYLILVSVLLSGCFLIGYDKLAEDEDSGSAVDPGDAGTGVGHRGDSSVGPVIDANGDANMDANAESAAPDSTTDSSFQDASESGSDAMFDDAFTDDECITDTDWCEGDKLMSCDRNGDTVLKQDCSTLGNICEVGICNSTENRCEKAPVSTDEFWCEGEILMSCTDQGAEAINTDCTTLSDECNTGVCNANSKQCEKSPLIDKIWCDGDKLRTCSEQGSVLTTDCAILDDECNTGLCNPELSECETTPIVEAKYWCEADVLYTCNDEGSKTAYEHCTDRSDVCNDGVCDVEENICIKQPKADETLCLDDILITCNSSGELASEQNCSDLDDGCNQGVCRTSDGNAVCAKEPFQDNRPCGAGRNCDSQGRCVTVVVSCDPGVNCDLACDIETSPCLLNCGNASVCNVTCGVDSTCYIDCASASECNVYCRSGSICDIECIEEVPPYTPCTVDCSEPETTCTVT